MKTIENNGLEKFSLNFSSWASRDVVPLMLLKRTISLMKCPVSDRFPESIRLILKFISGNILAVLVNFSVGNESEPDKKLNISAFNWKFWPARRILEREGSVLLQKKSFPPYCEIISYLTWSSCCMKEIWGVLSSNAYFLNKRDGQKKRCAGNPCGTMGKWKKVHLPLHARFVFPFFAKRETSVPLVPGRSALAKHGSSKYQRTFIFLVLKINTKKKHRKKKQARVMTKTD